MKKETTKIVAESLQPISTEQLAESIDITAQVETIEEEQPNPVVEIAPGMTSEEMKALFFDEDSLIEPEYKIYQLNSKGHRYYYTYDDDGEPVFFPSVTTIISQTTPTPPHLIKWIADQGYEEAERYKMERAMYGTFMHAQFEELLIARAYDLNNLRQRLLDYIENNRLPQDFIYYADDFKKDILSFAQFMLDYDVKPLAVEISLVHPEWHYAGMIDLRCTMLAKPGKEERIEAIVDFKSGKKGFYEDHEIQLGLYRELWNVNYPDRPVEKIFNFAPKDWRKKPTYNLKDQTKSKNLAKIPYLLDLAAIEDEKIDSTFTEVSGMIQLDGQDLMNNVTSLTLSEIVKKKTKKKEEESEKPQISDSDASKDENGIITPQDKESGLNRKSNKNN